MVRRWLYEALRGVAESNSGPPEQFRRREQMHRWIILLWNNSFAEIRIRGILRWSRNEALGASRGGGGGKEQEKEFFAWGVSAIH